MNRFETGMLKLLLAQLSELYYCERQLAGLLDRMAAAAMDRTLTKQLRLHQRETVDHARRLAEAFAELGEQPREVPCRVTKGLVEHGLATMDIMHNDPALDHALVAAAQRIELFETASYSSVLRLARTLGQPTIARVAQEILDEEMAAHAQLERIVHTLDGEPQHTA